MAAGGRPGDWQCPNTECINNKKMVFAKNESCPQCGEIKPDLAGRERSRSPRRGAEAVDTW
jgi:hypothetical protein